MDKVFTLNGEDFTPVEYVWNALYEMGYSSFGILRAPEDWDYRIRFGDYFGIRRSIDLERPVYGTYETTWAYGPPMAFIIDNYKLDTNKGGGLDVTYHLIAGDDGVSDGWYFPHIITEGAILITGIYWPE